VPAREPDVGAELISQLNPASVVCIDDLDHVTGVDVWEEAILELYERLLSSDGSLLIAASQPPLALGLSLADLATRLASGGVYRLHPLAEGELPSAMRLRAHRRGLDLPDAVVEYLLRRVPRDSNALFDLLDKVDEAAFARQRRLTVPFIKQIEKEKV
jgi:DnaA family protein